jgi:hypothetical protein
MAQPPRLYMVDSSAWIPALRSSPAPTALQQRLNQVQSEKCRVQRVDRCAFHLGFGLDRLLAANAVATMGMIRLELLRGARDQNQYHQLQSMLNGLHQLPATDDLDDLLRRAGEIQRDNLHMLRICR